MKKKLSFAMLVALVVLLVAVPAFAKTEVESADEDGKVDVTFIYEGDLDANAAFVAGQFNDWSPNSPMWRMEKKDDAWQVTKTLDKGEEYEYKFTVYGGGELEWVKDEDASTFASDGFGGENSVLIADTSVNLEPRVKDLEKDMASVNQGFSYSGYARAGTLMSTEGGAMNSYHGLFLDSYSRWRLGNEHDTYVENVFKKKFTQDDGSWMEAQFRLANKKTDYHNYNSQDDQESTIREAFVQGGGFDVAPDVTFWAGERFYGRSDIHITDNRWRELDGFGGGAQGIDLGPTTLDAAYLVRNSQGDGASLDTDSDLGGEVQQNIDLRFKDIQVPVVDGQLEFEVKSSWINAADSSADKDGIELSAIYTRPDFYGLLDGSSTAVVRTGDSVAVLGNSYNAGVSGEASSTALITYGLANINENWDVMPQFVYETSDDLYEDLSGNPYTKDNPGSEDRIIVGARAIRHITDHFSMQFEYGMESYDQEDGWLDDEQLQKFTVAPTLKLEDSFWGRPEIRAFATYANYDVTDGAAGGGLRNGDGIPELFRGDDNSGMTYGVQTELWW